MSTDFRPLTPIHFAELFDGRLKDLGVHEHQNKDQPSIAKCLTDGRNFLWVHSNEQGFVDSFTRFGGNSPQRILRAIADKFDVDILSEYEPEFWGYETEEEWHAAWATIAEKDEQDFYNDVVRFVRGDSHEIGPGTIGMIRAEIAKRLVWESPELLDEDKRRELIKAVEVIYDRDHAVKVTLSQQEMDLAKMVATESPRGHRTHRTYGPNNPAPAEPASPVSPMPDALDVGAVPPGGKAEI